MAKVQGVYIPKRIYAIKIGEPDYRQIREKAVYGENFPQAYSYSLSEFDVSSINADDSISSAKEKKVLHRVSNLTNNSRKVRGRKVEYEALIFENKPTAGWKLLKYSKDIADVIAPNGFCFRIPKDNLRYILYTKGLDTPSDDTVPVLKGEYVYGNMYGKKGQYLIPVGTRFHAVSKNFSSKIGDKVSLRSVKPNTIVETPYAENEVKYMGGWYFSCIHSMNIFSQGKTNERIPPSEVAAVKLLNVRRRYISQDEKSVLINGYQKVPEAHQKFVVSKVIDDSNELKSKEAQKIVNSIMSAKIDISDTSEYSRKGDFIEGWRSLLKHIQTGAQWRSGGDVPIPCPRTLLVKCALDKKPKKFEGKWILEKRTKEEKIKFLREAAHRGADDVMIPSGLYFMKHKDYDNRFFALLNEPTESYYRGKSHIKDFSNIENLVKETTKAQLVKGCRTDTKPYPQFMSFILRDAFVEDRADDKINLKQNMVAGSQSYDDYIEGLFDPDVRVYNPSTRTGRYASYGSKEIYYKLLDKNYIINNSEDFDMFELKIGINGKYHGISVGAL